MMTMDSDPPDTILLISKRKKLLRSSLKIRKQIERERERKKERERERERKKEKERDLFRPFL